MQAPVCQFRIAHSLDKSPSPIKKAFEVADHIVPSVSAVHANVDGHIEQFDIKKQIGTDCAALCGSWPPLGEHRHDRGSIRSTSFGQLTALSVAASCSASPTPAHVD